MKTRSFFPTLLLGLLFVLLVLPHALPASAGRNNDRKTRRAEQAAATARSVDSILRSERFLFVPNRVVTQITGIPYANLNTYYEVAVTPDSLVCSLPYYGYVYNTIYNPDRSPFFFTAPDPAIRVENLPAGKQKGWIVIGAHERSNHRSYILTFEIFDIGETSLTIQGSGTQHLQFLGTLRPLPAGEPAANRPEIR